MTDSTIQQLVGQIHAAPWRVVLAVTGGGSDAIAQLLQVSGASRTVLEAIVPYTDRALAALLGAAPEQHCSPSTARAMAMAAFCRAIELSAEGAIDRIDREPLAGIACTASLASDRPKRGPHRAHVAVQTATFTATASLTLAKGKRSRRQEEQLVARLILNQVSQACDVAAQLQLDLIEPEEVHTTRTDAEPKRQELLLGTSNVMRLGQGPSGPAGGVPAVIFPGAFNPLHEGHRHMAQLAETRLAVPVQFELSIDNVDKPPLDYTEIAQRVAQFSPERPLWLTRAATFLEKSKLFPGAAFVVGADTMVRIVDARYYGGGAEACRRAIDEIARRECRFLVFGRMHGGRFQTLGELELPAEILPLCDEVSAAAFRSDTSSTELRRQGRL